MRNEDPAYQSYLTSSRLIARNTLINLIGLSLPFLVTVAAIPFLIDGLGTDRFGVLTLIWAVFTYFTLFDLGLSRALTKLVADRMVDSQDSIPGLAWTAMAFMLLLGLVGALLLILTARWFVFDLLNVPADLRDETVAAFRVIALAVPALVLGVGFSGLLAARQRFDLINAVRIPVGLLMFIGPLLVLPFSTSLVWVAAALVVSRYFGLVAAAYFSANEYPSLLRHAGISRGELSPLLRFGGWMTISNILSPIMVTLDRFLIGTMVSVAAVAYYATPYEAATRVSIIPTALAGVLFPAFSLSSKKDPGKARLLFQRSVKFLYLLLLPLSLIIILFARDILELWLGSTFADESTLVLQLLGLGVFFNSLALVPFAFIQGAGRPDITAKLHMVEFPFYAVAVVFAIRQYGFEGAAFVWALRMAVDAAALFFFSGRLMGHPAASSVRMMLVAALSLGLMLLAFVPENLYFKLALIITFLFLYLPVAWSRILDVEERASLWRMFGRGRQQVPSS